MKVLCEKASPLFRTKLSLTTFYDYVKLISYANDNTKCYYNKNHHHSKLVFNSIFYIYVNIVYAIDNALKF